MGKSTKKWITRIEDVLIRLIIFFIETFSPEYILKTYIPFDKEVISTWEAFPVLVATVFPKTFTISILSIVRLSSFEIVTNPVVGLG